MVLTQALSLLYVVTTLTVTCVLAGSAPDNQQEGATQHKTATHMVGDVTYKDLLVWTAKHSHRNCVLKHRLSLDGLVVKVLHSKVTQQMGLMCIQRTVRACDLRTMAQLLMLEDSPCTLLQEYQMCVDRETEHCLSGEATILKTSLSQLLTGLQQQGHCAGVSRKPQVTAQTSHVKTPRPCARRAAWVCTVSFVEDLKSSLQTTCATITNFRHCLHIHSSSCGHHSADLLRRGSRGLSRLYRRLTHQC